MNERWAKIIGVGAVALSLGGLIALAIAGSGSDIPEAEPPDEVEGDDEADDEDEGELKVE